MAELTELVQTPCKDPSAFFRIPTEGLVAVEEVDSRGRAGSMLYCPEATRTSESWKRIRTSARSDEGDSFEENFSN